MTRGYIFSDDEAKRVAAAVYANEGRPPHQLPPRPRPIRAGGGCGCEEIHRFVTNGPTFGTFSVTYNINGTDRTVTWNWDDGSSDVQSDFDALSTYFNDVEVYGGDWPNVAIYVKWLNPPDDVKGLSNWPVVDSSSLIGGQGFMDKFSFAK